MNGFDVNRFVDERGAAWTRLEHLLLRVEREGIASLPLPAAREFARLYRAVSNITDCLCVPRVAKEDFATGEPNYFFVGARAYGRSRTFLLQTGLQQLETILDSL